MAALRIVPTGLAMPWPAISGAEPWIGSYSPEVGLKEVEGTDGGPANEAEGRRPREPGITLDWSDRLHGSKSCSVRTNRCRVGHLHVTKQIFSQDYTIQFSWIRYDQHGSRVNEVMIQF